MKHTLHDHMGGYVLAHHSNRPPEEARAKMAVTISRQAGAGGSSVARRLAEYLDRYQPAGAHPWKVYDNNLIGEVLQRHGLPARVGEYMPEDAAHFVPDTVEDLLGLHPSAPEMVRRVSETMVALARGGNVILVGRGGNIVTRHLPGMIHLRLVASFPQRIRHLQGIHDLSQANAAKLAGKIDRARARYLRQNFGVRIEESTNYDLVINTSRLGFERTASLVGDMVLEQMKQATSSAPN